MIESQKQLVIMDKLIADPKVKTFRLTLRGQSMRPFLKPGMEIKFRKIGPSRQPAVGEVAAIRCRNGILVHRILRIRGPDSAREYFTKGDRRLAGDGWVESNKIIGIIIRENRYQRLTDLAAAGFSLLLLGLGKLLKRRRR